MGYKDGYNDILKLRQVKIKYSFDEGQCSDFDPDTDVDINFFEEFRRLAGLSLIVNKEQIFNNLKIVLSNGKFKNGGVLFNG